jgi:hypothetical protein
VRKPIVASLCALILAACTHGATGKWEDKLIQGPGITPEASKVYLVRDGKRHWVLHSQWIVAHGYRWPQDVNHISLDELNAVPLADPILDPS